MFPGPQIVLVTGVAGFIGSHLAEEMLRLGHVVIGVDRRSPQSSPTAAANLHAPLTQPRFRLCMTGMEDGALTPLLRDVTTVFHLAAVTGVRRSWGRCFADYLTSNVLATQRLLEACGAEGVSRVVIASSSSVYGQTSGRPSKGDDPTLPGSPYGVSKLAAEQLALVYARRPESPFSVVALRYFTVYGPRQRDDMAMAWMFRAALTGTPMQMYGEAVSDAASPTSTTP